MSFQACCHIFEEKHGLWSFQVGKYGSHTQMEHLSIHVLNMRKVEKQNQKSELKHGNVHIYLHTDVLGMPVECVKAHPLEDKPCSFGQICCRKMEV